MNNESSVAIIAIDYPPVNALSHGVRTAIVTGLEQALSDPEITGIVLCCKGRTFFAGADITEFDVPMQEPSLDRVLEILDNTEKPVVAAIHGTALGGGLEVALTCNYRIAVPSAKMGLPEVVLGLIPGAGGTQRLPRLIGVGAALDMILSGAPVAAPAALKIGIVDRLAPEGDLLKAAVAFAGEMAAAGGPLPRVSRRDDRLDEARGQLDAICANALKGQRGPAQPAQRAAVEAVSGSVELPFAQGIALEHRLVMDLMRGDDSRARRHAFFAERESAKYPGITSQTPTRKIGSIAILGAGTMGTGIALAALDGGFAVKLIDPQSAALDRAKDTVGKTHQRLVAKGRISEEQAGQRLAMLSLSDDMAALGDADLVIEAVFEDLTLKKEIFGKIDRLAKPGAILASNTSFLDVNELAAATSRPKDVIGLHFFSPANIMRLLEIVNAEKTDLSVLATALSLAKALHKIPVVSGVCHGFIANRAMDPRWVQAEALALEGVPFDQIDRVSVAYGFPMGPFAMMDLVGIDVLGRGEENTILAKMYAAGLYGQKVGKGFYVYEDGKSKPSDTAQDLIAAYAESLGKIKVEVSDTDILDRLLLPVVNECAKLLEEGIALRASDIDIALIAGYSWPIGKGGPTFWADMIGLGEIEARMLRLEQTVGPVYRPAPLLSRLAAEHSSFNAPKT